MRSSLSTFQQTPMKMTRTNARSAFTLIEMLIVVTLVSIATAMIMPRSTIRPTESTPAVAPYARPYSAPRPTPSTHSTTSWSQSMWRPASCT